MFVVQSTALITATEDQHPQSLTLYGPHSLTEGKLAINWIH